MSASVAGYRTVLRLPGARHFFFCALVGRLSYGIVGLALLLVLRTSTGSYADAGAALAGFGLTTSLLAPVRGRWIDRYGVGITLTRLSAAFAVVLAVMAAVSWRAHHSSLLLITLALVAGCVPPPLGPTTRQVWSRIAADPAQLRTAYSLDTVSEEVLFTVGPILTGVIAAAANGAVALMLGAAVNVIGTLAMSRSPLVAGAAFTGRAAAGARPLRQPAFRRLVLTLFGLGAALGGVDVAVLSIVSQQHRGSTTAGMLLAVYSLGSAVGGSVFGRLSSMAEVPKPLPRLVSLLTLGLVCVALAPDLPLLGVTIFATGLAVAPTLVVAYTLADQITGAAHRTEASTLVNSGNNLGGAAGAAGAGILVDRHGGHVTLLVSAAVTGATAMLLGSATSEPLDGR
jgi:MFS family permease